jgi:glutamine amidotransferase
MIFVVDYGRGNLFSLGQALRKLGTEPVISDDPTALARADRIIFPGVGAFGDAMAGLRQRGLIEPLRAAARSGTPILGICVGCQLMLTRGEEFGLHDGLDLIPGTVARLPDSQTDDPDGVRIPNVGWRPLDVRTDAPVVGSLRPNDWMYFVHSYAPMVDDENDIAATIHVNGADIPVAIARGNIAGVQFHPEKSGPAGLRLLAQFLETEIGS